MCFCLPRCCEIFFGPLIGGKKNNNAANAIINPKTGKLEVENKQIKNISLQYCIETLENNKPAEGFEDYIDLYSQNSVIFDTYYLYLF